MRAMSHRSTLLLGLGAILLSSLAPLTAHATHGPCVPPDTGQETLFLYPTGSIPSGTNPGDCEDPSCSPYINDNLDPWLQDSWYQNNGEQLSLTVESQQTQPADSTGYGQLDTYLVIAIRGTTTSDQVTSITISGGPSGPATLPYSAFMKHDPDDENPFVDERSHGVYEPSGDALYAFYRVGPIATRINGEAHGGTVNLTVTAATDGDPNLFIHFDAFDCGTGDRTFQSSDLTWIGPETPLPTPSPTAGPTATPTPIGACPLDADAGCLTGFEKANLLIKEDILGKEKLVAKMVKGPALAQTDLGDPLSGGGTAYSLCIYDDAGNLAGGIDSSIVVDRAGEECNGHRCWKPIGKDPPDGKGYKYKDAALAADGVLKLLYKGGAAGKSKVIVTGKGPLLPHGIPAALQSTTFATVQLRSSDGICLSGAVDNIKKQQPTFFKAKFAAP